MKITRENFSLKKFKKTNAGVQVGYLEKVTLENGVQSSANVNKTYKEDPHPELIDALEAIDEIVMYDEDYKKGAVIKITGVTVFPEIETAIITHLKETNSGNTARNSGRIAKESETFKKAAKLFDLIDILENEVFEYVVNGKRAQLALFEPGEPEEQEEPEPALEAV